MSSRSGPARGEKASRCSSRNPRPPRATEMRIFIALLGVAIFGSGCTVGLNYKKPTIPVPGTYRGLPPEEAGKTDAASLGDQKWWEVFQDEQLRSLIRTALQQNYDVRIAGARILQAQAQLGITRADQFPTIAGGAEATNQRSPQSRFLPAFKTSANQVN